MFLPTQTQYRILEHLRRGYSNKQIAAAVSLSVPAVEYHIHRLFHLSDTTNRVELAIWWTEYRAVNPFTRAVR
jgi:DNA-binding NarL/FixJ family response regulator